MDHAANRPGIDPAALGTDEERRARPRRTRPRWARPRGARPQWARPRWARPRWARHGWHVDHGGPSALEPGQHGPDGRDADRHDALLAALAQHPDGPPGQVQVTGIKAAQF